MECCKSCGNYSYVRICDLMRHIKKCDKSCKSYSEYLIKYTCEDSKIPKCLSCENGVKITKNKIYKYCEKCNKVKYVSLLSTLAKDRYCDITMKQEILNKRKKTNLLKYGTCAASQSEEIKNKTIKTNIMKYGIPTTLQLIQVKTKRNEAFTVKAESINMKRSNAWNTDLINQASNARKNTVLLKYGVEYISQVEDIRLVLSNKAKLRYLSNDFKIKCKELLFKKYGVYNVSQLASVKKSIINTSNINFGADNYLSSNIRRKLEEDKNNWIPLELIKDFEKYHRLCIIETNKHIPVLFANWNGRCYYSSVELLTSSIEYNNPKYRTIDHKISIFYGFVNNIPPQIIGNINNLCICSREYNTKKNKKCHGI